MEDNKALQVVNAFNVEKVRRILPQFEGKAMTKVVRAVLLATLPDGELGWNDEELEALRLRHGVMVMDVCQLINLAISEQKQMALAGWPPKPEEEPVVEPDVPNVGWLANDRSPTFQSTENGWARAPLPEAQ